MTAIHLPGISDDDDRTLNLLLAKLERKAERNRLRAQYYDMKKVARFVGSAIPPQYRQVALVLGWSAKAVDTLVRRCRLDGFVWPDGELGSIG